MGGKPGKALVGKVLLVLALAILVGLGTWQLRRLAWKEALLARIEALKAAPAEPLAVALRRLPDGGEADFVRVTGACPDLAARPYLRLHALHEGVLGYRLIAACPVADGPYRSILVDRGFVAQEEAASVTPDPTPLAAPLVGVLRKADTRNAFTPADRPDQNLWYGRDVNAMAAALGAPGPAPLFLMLESPAPRSGRPLPAAIPTDIPNRHLEYALTWFGLALALLGVYIARRLGARRSQAKA
jgi:surfeit locus 1 family protein